MSQLDLLGAKPHPAPRLALAFAWEVWIPGDPRPFAWEIGYAGRKPAIVRTQAYRRWRRQAHLQLDNRRINPRPPGLELPISGPVALRVGVVLPRPGRKPSGYPLRWTADRRPLLRTPDIDNLHKAAQDALVAAGVLPDDDLVVGIEVWKWYAAADEAEHVEIEIFRVTEGE